MKAVGRGLWGEEESTGPKEGEEQAKNRYFSPGGSPRIPDDGYPSKMPNIPLAIEVCESARQRGKRGEYKKRGKSQSAGGKRDFKEGRRIQLLPVADQWRWD